jgi:hypothetical protein
MNLTSVIGQYKKLRGMYPDKHLQNAVDYSNISDAIDHAAQAIDNEKKHPHQHRIPNATLDSFAQNLQKNKSNIANAQTFDDLITEVEKAKISGIGDLAVYDTALRIGVYLNLHPTQVYLHQGTRTGAEKLLGKKLSGIKSLPVNCFPIDLQQLSAAEIEDILCIYKDSFDPNSAIGTNSDCIPKEIIKSKSTC